MPKYDPTTNYIPEPNTGCYLFLGHCGSHGYGRVQSGKGPNRKSEMLHRVVWKKAGREIPDGMLICHKCDTPSCINLDHLFLGTEKDNRDDMYRKGRQAKGERHGQTKLTLETVLRIRELRAQGKKVKDLAKEFSSSPATVSRICNHRVW